MGSRAYVATETDITADFDNSKIVSNFWIGLANHCHTPSLEYEGVWYSQLEAVGKTPLSDISTALRQAAWHSEAIYTEDEYERWVESGKRFQHTDLSREAFTAMLEKYHAAYQPVDALIEDVRRIIERVQAFQPSIDMYEWYEKDILLNGLTGLLAAFKEVQAAGAQKACLMFM